MYRARAAYIAILAGLTAVFSASAALPAHAYIDPVTTSIALQVLAGGAAAAFVAFRRFRDRVLGLFRRRSDPKPGERDGK
jgi:hypothetical protein